MNDITVTTAAAKRQAKTISTSVIFIISRSINLYFYYTWEALDPTRIIFFLTVMDNMLTTSRAFTALTENFERVKQI